MLDLRRRKSRREDYVEQRRAFQCSDEASFKINHRSLVLGNQKGWGTNDWSIHVRLFWQRADQRRVRRSKKAKRGRMVYARYLYLIF